MIQNWKDTRPISTCRQSAVLGVISSIQVSFCLLQKRQGHMTARQIVIRLVGDYRILIPITHYQAAKLHWERFQHNLTHWYKVSYSVS